MVKYLANNITSKRGVNHVRSIVEHAGCLFHKIEHEGDLGVDGLIEFIRDEVPLNRQVAVQIKSGASFHNKNSRICTIPVGSHRDYWKNHPLPVFGIVFAPSTRRAYWVDIKDYLSEHPKGTTITFPANETNRFDLDCFKNIFTAMILRDVPKLSYSRATRLFHSSEYEEFRLGLAVLFSRFSNRRAVWTAMFDRFKTLESNEIPASLVHYIAHVPWHPDIIGHGEQLTKSTRAYAKSLLNKFTRPEIEKLLSQIDAENGICRGSIGQSVEAIISCIDNIDPLLKSIALDRNADSRLRDCAALILAMHIDREALPVLDILAKEGSRYSRDIGVHLREFGFVNPY